MNYTRKWEFAAFVIIEQQVMTLEPKLPFLHTSLAFLRHDYDIRRLFVVKLKFNIL